MAYTVLTDYTPPAGTSTSVGSGANSTTGVPGLIDLAGNQFSLDGAGDIAGAGGNPLTQLLYSPASASVANGEVSAYSTGADSNHAKGGGFRFSTTGGVSGYSVWLYNNQYMFFFKSVAGVATNLGSPAIGVTLSGAIEVRVTCQQINSTTTQLTGCVYAASNPTTPLFAPIVMTDSEPTLQNVAGMMGFTGGYEGFAATRLVFSQASPQLTATSSAVQPYRTRAQLTGQAATGGTAPITYQWYRSTTPGFTPGSANAIAGATALSYLDTGLAAGTTYNYVLAATDATTADVLYAQESVTTFAADLGRSAVMVHIGDSITQGVGSTTLNAVLTEVAALNGIDFQAVTFDEGQSGATTTNWLPGVNGLGFLAPVLVQIAAIGADTVSIMLGTNDSKASARTSFAAYASNLQTIIAACLAAGAVRVILNEPPWVVPGSFSGDYDTTAATVQIPGYIAQLNALANGGTILRGSVRTYAYFEANAAARLAVDGVHPDQIGHTWLGNEWATALLGQVAEVQKPNVALPPVGEVVAGTAYGSPQASLVGTYVPTYAAVTDVRNGVNRGDGETGTLVVTAPDPAAVANAMWTATNRTLTS